METKRFEIDGVWYEVRKVEPETTELKLPTLMEVFNKVKPEWVIGEANENRPEGFVYDNNIYHNQLSTESQCKRIQSLIAMQVIADMYNEEVDYRGIGGYYIYLNEASGEWDVSSGYCVTKFKFHKHAWKAIEILRAENLLDNLK